MKLHSMIHKIYLLYLECTLFCRIMTLTLGKKSFFAQYSILHEVVYLSKGSQHYLSVVLHPNNMEQGFCVHHITLDRIYLSQ